MGQSRGGATTREIASDTGAVFEVERFEWADDGRIELQGAWSNLRGTRFVRPALELDAGGTRHRLLALLDHKPWAPGDNGRWQAAFTWDGHVDDVEAAQLTVAPGIVIELPVAGSAGNLTKARAAAPMKRRPRRAAPSERARAAAPKSSATKSSATKADTPSDDATQQLDGSAPADSPEVTALRRDLEAALERADAAE